MINVKAQKWKLLWKVSRTNVKASVWTCDKGSGEGQAMFNPDTAKTCPSGSTHVFSIVKADRQWNFFLRSTDLNSSSSQWKSGTWTDGRSCGTFATQKQTVSSRFVNECSFLDESPWQNATQIDRLVSKLALQDIQNNKIYYTFRRWSIIWDSLFAPPTVLNMQNHYEKHTARCNAKRG